MLSWKYFPRGTPVTFSTTMPSSTVLVLEYSYWVPGGKFSGIANAMSSSSRGVIRSASGPSGDSR
ncbi:hypothetical protein MPHL21000_12960 [Mycolicibacterium phlei DSM 43239 = CCUG 21000]|uniref:Uncharacterized protein n=1 Tax=Mycolicibacterium phlei DSM 43239 = CCUG 21000 TaxID=1226750 RepID=A0A5N5V253_MYCPH|nr:hypothetical protein MPHL21000_12960 [Mycolicibacterium phlei DSM 43239 = CCUG 21000]